MPIIDSLWGKHKDEICFIIGTGPSISYYPPGFIKSLEGKLTIGLNEAFKYHKCKYNLSVHYDCIILNPDLLWITKHKVSDVKIDISNYTIFKSNTDYGLSVKDFSLIGKPGCLYVGRGIHTSAMVLAAQMGCRMAVLIGVDCGSLNDKHHGHKQHVQFHGLEPEEVYNEYYENAVKVREVIWNKYQMGVMSMSPFIGLYSADQDVHQISNLYPVIQDMDGIPKDISTYKRRKVDRFL